MSLYRATNKLIGRFMSCSIPARAIAVNAQADMHTDAGIAGRQFAELIDPASRSFSMPAHFVAPSTKQMVVVMAQQIGDNGESPVTGKLFLNKNFEAEFRAASQALVPHLVQNGWLESVSSLADDSVPAAVNM